MTAVITMSDRDICMAIASALGIQVNKVSVYYDKDKKAVNARVEMEMSIFSGPNTTPPSGVNNGGKGQ